MAGALPKLAAGIWNAYKRSPQTWIEFSIWFKSSENNPEEELDEQELHNTLKKALKTLSEREAMIIQLYYVEELNVFEISEVLEISTGRVSQIKKEAIKNLRNFINSENQF